jgi:hypothetical protein
MSDDIIRKELIRLAYEKPEMRDTLIPIINEFAQTEEESHEKAANKETGESVELEPEDEKILSSVWANIAKNKAKYKKHDEWMARRVHLDSKDK